VKMERVDYGERNVTGKQIYRKLEPGTVITNDVAHYALPFVFDDVLSKEPNFWSNWNPRSSDLQNAIRMAFTFFLQAFNTQSLGTPPFVKLPPQQSLLRRFTESYRAALHAPKTRGVLPPSLLEYILPTYTRSFDSIIAAKVHGEYAIQNVPGAGQLAQDPLPVNNDPRIGINASTRILEDMLSNSNMQLATDEDWQAGQRDIFHDIVATSTQDGANDLVVPPVRSQESLIPNQRRLISGGRNITVFPSETHGGLLPKMSMFIQQMTRLGVNGTKTVGYILHIFVHDPNLNMGEFVKKMIDYYRGDQEGVNYSVNMKDPPYDMRTISESEYIRLCQFYKNMSNAKTWTLDGIESLGAENMHPYHPENVFSLSLALNRFATSADDQLTSRGNYSTMVKNVPVCCFPNPEFTWEILPSSCYWANENGHSYGDGLQLAPFPWQSERNEYISSIISSFVDIYPNDDNPDELAERNVSIDFQYQTPFSKGGRIAAERIDRINSRYLEYVGALINQRVSANEIVDAHSILMQTLLSDKERLATTNPELLFENSNGGISTDSMQIKRALAHLQQRKWQFSMGSAYALETLYGQSVYLPRMFPSVTPSLQRWRTEFTSKPEFKSLLIDSTSVKTKILTQTHLDTFGYGWFLRYQMIRQFMFGNMRMNFLICQLAAYSAYRRDYTLGLNPVLNGSFGSGKSNEQTCHMQLLIPGSYRPVTSRTACALNVDQNLDGYIEERDELPEYNEKEKGEANLQLKTAISKGYMSRTTSIMGKRRINREIKTSIIGAFLSATDRAIPISDPAMASRLMQLRYPNTNIGESFSEKDITPSMELRYRTEQLRVAMAFELFGWKHPIHISTRITRYLITEWNKYISELVVITSSRLDQEAIMLAQINSIINACDIEFNYRTAHPVETRDDDFYYQSLSPTGIRKIQPYLHDTVQIAIASISIPALQHLDPLFKLTIQALYDLAHFPYESVYHPDEYYINRSSSSSSDTVYAKPTPSMSFNQRLMAVLYCGRVQLAVSKRPRWKQTLLDNLSNDSSDNKNAPSGLDINYVEVVINGHSLSNLAAEISGKIAAYFPSRVIYNADMILGILETLQKWKFVGQHVQPITVDKYNDMVQGTHVELEVDDTSPTHDILVVNRITHKLYISTHVLNKLLTYEMFVKFMKNAVEDRNVIPRRIYTAFPKMSEMDKLDSLNNYHYFDLSPNLSKSISIPNKDFVSDDVRSLRCLLEENSRTGFFGSHEAFPVDCDLDDWAFWMHNLQNMIPYVESHNAKLQKDWISASLGLIDEPTGNYLSPYKPVKRQSQPTAETMGPPSPRIRSHPRNVSPTSGSSNPASSTSSTESSSSSSSSSSATRHSLFERLQESIHEHQLPTSSPRSIVPIETVPSPGSTSSMRIDDEHEPDIVLFDDDSPPGSPNGNIDDEPHKRRKKDEDDESDGKNGNDMDLLSFL
jgi:hypothetical protein